jgi:hypothetical protein
MDLKKVKLLSFNLTRTDFEKPREGFIPLFQEWVEVLAVHDPFKVKSRE